MISLSPVVEGLKRVEKGVDRTALELAIVLLKIAIGKWEQRYRTIDTQSSAGTMLGGIALATGAGFMTVHGPMMGGGLSITGGFWISLVLFVTWISICAAIISGGRSQTILGSTSWKYRVY